VPPPVAMPATFEPLQNTSDSYFKKTDADLSQILGISESTVRSRRTKLKEKLK
jgi:hypothetical protein